MLAEWLRRVHQREVISTREPGGTRLGRILREQLLHGQDLDARTEALLFAADRAHHVATVIRPALAAGAVVLTDRYLDSSVDRKSTRLNSSHVASSYAVLCV